MRHTAIFQSAMLLALTALGASTATAQTDFSFAAGVDSTGWAQAQSNADGHVLIESPQYPHGLWLHLVNEAGDALDGIQVEYQGRPDSLVAIRCVDPAGSVQETLIWSRPEGNPLHLTLNPEEASDELPAGISTIDWQIDPTVVSLLEPTEETRLIGWEAVRAFLRERWQDQAGRVPVQLNASTVLAVEVDHPETIETLVDRLQQMYQSAGTPLGENAAVAVQLFNGGSALQAGVILYLPLFLDANLESAVREMLGRPLDLLTLEDVPSLTHLIQLGASLKKIYSLVGLDYLTALQTLDLQYNQIADVRPLVGLTNLQELWLSGNQIADVGPLAGLTNLQELWLSDNQIADVGPLAGLTNLQELWLSGNQIADVGPLAGLTNLQELWLWSNQLTDVGPLAGLTNLQGLGLSDNQIADVTTLANLHNLQILGLRQNQLTDVGPLAGLTNLISLWLSDNRIADVGPLANLNNLYTLRLSDNQLTDVGPLANLNNLQELRLHNNQLTDVRPLANLTNLDYLELSSNRIADVGPLANLNNLRSLFLDNNPLSDQALNKQIPALQARGVRVYF